MLGNKTWYRAHGINMISGWSIVTFVRSSTYQRNAFYIHKLHFLMHSNDKEEFYSNKIIATQIQRRLLLILTWYWMNVSSVFIYIINSCKHFYFDSKILFEFMNFRYGSFIIQQTMIKGLKTQNIHSIHICANKLLRSKEKLTSLVFAFLVFNPDQHTNSDFQEQKYLIKLFWKKFSH